MVKTLSLLVIFIVGIAAQSLPLPRGPRSEVQIPSTFTNDYNFEGIVGLDNCSGSLMRFENSKDTDLAMVLTNGHCLEFGFPDPGTFVFGKPSSRSFNLLDAGGNQVANLQATEVIYSTMTKTDITIYKLDQTYADILSKYSIRPLTLSSKHPDLNQSIEVISGYWFRGYSCAIEFFSFHLKEEGYTWDDSVRYTRPGCEVIGGTSGSPVVAAGTRTVIAINNTGNENGQRCTENNPCEVDSDGNISFQQGYSYAEETYFIYSCVNQNNELDLTVKGCQLPH